MKRKLSNACLELLSNHVSRHRKFYEKRGLVCIQSVYPLSVKIYLEMKYIMNSVYNEAFNSRFLFINIPRVY
jgi:hypothetical protein